ncbi:MAG: DUF935 family protein [Bacteroidales bacterium]|jgi:hypothetical protein|nr:DUF935 family protein [Bacteroidales bacterium]
MDKNILESKEHGTFDLTKEKDRRRLKKVVIDLQRYTDMLTEHDISHWRYACQLAVNVENPSRLQLYDIYNDVDLDAHLTGAIGQVNGFVKCRSFKLTNPKGDTVKEAEVYFNTEWFKDLLDYILESIYWGHSLIELGNVITDDNGNINFDGVKLIPRKHVIPEYGRIVKNLGEGWQYGIDYRTPPYSDWLIEAGKKDDLGLYRKAALHTIPKKYAGAFWDTFAEMFGIPVRIAKTTARDESERKKVASMMENMGAKAWGVFDDTTDIELVESSKGDAFNVYDKRIDRSNSELSKLVLKQTMTIEDGSSLSQSQTHMKVFKNLIEAYCDMVRDVINNQLLPKMVKHGFPVKGLTFNWDDPVDYTPEQQVAIEQMVLNNYEVDGSYFQDKYGIPAGERRNNGLPSLMGSKQDSGSFFD